MTFPHSVRRRGRIRPWMAAAAVTVVAIAVGVGVGVGAGVDDGAGGAGDGSAIVRTGERNSMGMPVIETPGTATGEVTAGDVEVVAANWALGRVPLNTAVRPSWILRNNGPDPVTVGEPHPEVREGCCPGAFSIGSTTIPPGGETTLSFELSMHPGMDGWHDFAVHVPVESASAGDQALTLGVTGDFR